MQCRPSALERSSVSVSVVLHDPLLRMGVLATLGGDERFSVRVDWESSEVPVDERLDRCLSGVHVLIAGYEAGVAIAGYARGRSALPRVMIVTRRDREAEIRRALEEGVLGYVLVGCGIEEIIAGVLSVNRGHRHLGYAAAQRIADSFTHQKLTVREAEVLGLLSAGLSNKMVARQLDVAVGTVKSHLRSIFDKLDAKTRTQAAAEAQRRGLVNPGTTGQAASTYPNHYASRAYSS